MKKDIKWINTFWFIAGVVVCYLSLQISLFDVKFEIQIIDTLIAISTICVGVYIAQTIQKNVNRSQNQYSYIENKLDLLWMDFIKFSKVMSYGDNTEITVVTNYFKDATPVLELIQSIFDSFEYDTSFITNLETELENLESYLTSLPVKDNIIEYKANKGEIASKSLQINKCFKSILKEINTK